MTEFGRQVAEALRAYRRRHRLTQVQLAQLLGWRQTYVSQLERGGGGTEPALRTIEHLSQRLGLIVELQITDPTPADPIEQGLQSGDSGQL